MKTVQKLPGVSLICVSHELKSLVRQEKSSAPCVHSAAAESRCGQTHFTLATHKTHTCPYLLMLVNALNTRKIEEMKRRWRRRVGGGERGMRRAPGRCICNAAASAVNSHS